MCNQLIFLSFLLLSQFNALSQKNVRTFVFGHSLINHEAQVNITPSNETSVPHWFHFLAEEGSHDYAVSGKYGFLTQHRDTNNVFAQWGFDSVTAAWDSDNEQFGEANFTNILITPANFIQYQSPQMDYYGDPGISPVSATTDVFKWCRNQEDSLIFYIYEGWPDMVTFLTNGFPPSQVEWDNYNDYTQNDFHDWFIEYHDALIDSFPNSQVKMIPVGSTISKLLQQPPFNQMAIDSLYEDDAPHGRPSIYFLSAMITYMAMYEEECPHTYQIDPIIEPIIGNNYNAIIEFIRSELTKFKIGSNGNSRVFCDQNYCEPIANRDSLDFSPYARANQIVSSETVKDSSSVKFFFEQNADLISGFKVDLGATLTVQQEDCN